jgi:ABC-2 type transport system ATP-binding protein
VNKGKLVACDTPDALREMVKQGEAVDIVVEAITNAQLDATRSIEGVLSVFSKTDDSAPGQTELRARLASINSLPNILDFFFKEKIKLINFKREEPTLEDAFIKLTEKGA